MNAQTTAPRWLTLASWLLLAVWGCATVVAASYPAGTAPKAIGAVAGPALILFVSFHAVRAFGWRGAGLFALLAFLIALALENLSIATGIPFGYFTHTNVFGAKIGAVPFAVALGYFLFGYPAWMLAQLVIGKRGASWAVPLVAAFVVTQFDLTHDAVGASVLGQWHYRNPSGLNGVPLSNFIGWLVTAGAIFLAWKPLAARFDRAPGFDRREFWALPIAFWALTALQYPLFFGSAPATSVTVGAARLPVANIYESSTILALLAMGFVVLLATVRLFETKTEIATTTN